MNTQTKYSILFAEDNENARKHTSKYLELYFEKVYEARDGVEALDIYKRLKPDVVVTDVAMPNMDGMALVKEIRKENIDIPIIMLTAYSAIDTLKEAVPLKLEDYVVKPINRRTFVDLIIKVINNLDEKNTLKDSNNNEILNECGKELNDLRKASVVMKAFKKKENSKESEEFNKVVDIISNNVEHITKTIVGTQKVC